MKPRPVLRYHGGKWLLAPWLISHFPEHRCYVEPFGGGASVLLRKNRCYAEIYNDLDGEIVNVFRVVRDNGDRLVQLLEITPFSREEYMLAWYSTDDPIEQARRTIIKSFMGFGSSAATMGRSINNGNRVGLPATGFRANSNRSGTTPAADWRNYPGCLPAAIERLRGVVIENRDGFEVMLQHDAATTLHYVDPPYVSETRDAGGDYVNEMTDADHFRLAELLQNLSGMVIISGYRCPMYDLMYAGWMRIDRKALADGARERVESIWLSPSASQRLPQIQMFGA